MGPWWAKDQVVAVVVVLTGSLQTHLPLSPCPPLNLHSLDLYLVRGASLPHLGIGSTVIFSHSIGKMGRSRSLLLVMHSCFSRKKKQKGSEEITCQSCERGFLIALYRNCGFLCVRLCMCATFSLISCDVFKRKRRRLGG